MMREAANLPLSVGESRARCLDERSEHATPFRLRASKEGSG
jgi:hypothetical protein